MPSLRTALLTLTACLMMSAQEAPPEGIRCVALLVKIDNAPAKTGVEDAQVQAQIEAYFRAKGIQIIQGNPEGKDFTHAATILLGLNRTEDGLLWHGVMLSFEPAKPGRIVEGRYKHETRPVFYLTGQKDPANFLENTINTTVQAMIDLQPELRKKFKKEDKPWMFFPFKNKAGLPEPSVMQFDKEALTVRKQPPAPAYPAGAREKGLQGTVEISVLVDETGLPVLAKALRGPMEFYETGIRYALGWEFNPMTLNGKASPGTFTLTIPFRLN